MPSGVVSSDAPPAAASTNRKKAAATPAVESHINSMPTSQGNKQEESSGGGYTTIQSAVVPLSGDAKKGGFALPSDSAIEDMAHMGNSDVHDIKDRTITIDSDAKK